MKQIISILICALFATTINAQSLSKEQLLQDFDYYFSQMELIHPDPYTAFGGKKGFDVAVKGLRNDLAGRDSLSLNEMQVEMTKLISALHDGHTNVGYPDVPEKVENAWTPLNLKVIPDGIVINGYAPEWECLKGARALEVEGEPLQTALERLDKTVITENRYGLMGKACKALCHNNSLRQLFPRFNKDSLSMKLRTASGKDTIVTLPFYPNGSKWKAFVEPSEDSRFPKENFEYRFADKQKQTMVMCINAVMSADVPGYQDSKVIVADAFAKMLREMKAAGSPRLIIDLRGNNGGWTMIMYAALYELYGERFLKTDLGFHFKTKLSEALLKRDSITLEQFNQMRGTALGLGDYYEEPSSIGSIDVFVCADKDILKAQNGKPIYTPMEIFVVTDERTFSAAFHFAYMMNKMGATIVGVPSGQSPNTFMELTPFKLPNSGLECSVSNSLQLCYPQDHPKAHVFTPDIQLTYKDYQKYNFSKDAELLYLMDYPGATTDILFEIRPEVNYVTHLYTLAGLGFSDEEYTAKYGNALPKAAVDTLQKYKDYLVFGQGEGGMLAGPFFFGVSRESFANADSLQLGVNAIIAEGKKTKASEDVMNAVHAIAKVYVDNYDNYLAQVYPQVKKDMENRQKELTQRLRDNSFVRDWERVTGYTWTHGDYHWLLYRAGEKGPSYNNLNENTNTVYYNQSIDYQLAMFSHEFGIFLMMDSISPIMEEMKAYTRSLNSEKDLTFVPWSAFESLACWYNCKIAGQETEDYRNFSEADVETFYQIYDRLSVIGIKNPSELYRKGIMEYLNKMMVLTAKAQEPQDSIESVNKLLELREVVVKGNLPNTRLKGNAMITRIQGTPLAGSGTLGELLVKVPGMTGTDEAPEVLGKGTPLIYINGRLMRDGNELKRLRSEDIRDVEVINNPGAEYDAQVRAVVRIRTRKQQGEGLGLGLTLADEHDLRYDFDRPQGTFDVNYRKNGVDVFASVYAFHQDYRQYSTLEEIMKTEDKVFRQYGPYTMTWKYNSLTYTTGVNWQLADNHSLGVRADLTHRPKSGTNQVIYDEDVFMNDVLTDHLYSHQTSKESKPLGWLTNTYYNGKVGKLGIDFNFDFMRNGTDTDRENVEQSQVQDDYVLSKSATRSRLYAAKLVLSYPVWKGEVEAGTEMTFVNRDNTYWIDKEAIANSDADVTENNVAAFAEYNCDFKKYGSASVGLRYEHTLLDYDDILDKDKRLHRSMDEWFPTAAYSVALGKVQTALSYSMKTYRPSFFAMNDAITYISRYMQQAGSAQLLNERVRDLTFNASYKWVTLTASYEHLSNPITQWNFPTSTGASLCKHINLDKPINTLSAYLAVTPRIGFWSLNATAGVEKQDLYLDVEGPQGIYRVYYDKPKYTLNAFNTFTLKHGWRFDVNLMYRSSGCTYVFYNNTYNLRLGFVAQKSLLRNNSLTLRAAVLDCLQRNRMNELSDYGYNQIQQNNRFSTHKLMLSLNYRLNATRSKYKGTGAGKETQARMGS